MTDGKETCWVLTGPTASGKTELSLRLAEKYGCEIVCMDSMQIYRGMDIGTAKPTREERARVPHHMLDVADPQDSFTVTRYQEMAEECVRQIQARGHRALFVGGTGFYLRALRHPMAMGTVGGDEALRNELRAAAAEAGGRERLHEMLRQVDPVTATRLPANDVRRVIRALEVERLTGKPFSMQEQPEGEPAFRYRVAVLTMDRALLYERINRRVDDMLRDGLVQEVRGLLESGVPRDAQALQAIGYKEILPLLDGSCTEQEAALALKVSTRHYAKRQLTWMKQEEDVYRVDRMEGDALRRLCAWFEQGESL